MLSDGLKPDYNASNNYYVAVNMTVQYPRVYDVVDYPYATFVNNNKVYVYTRDINNGNTNI
jgi:hypothetical protein